MSDHARVHARVRAKCEQDNDEGDHAFRCFVHKAEEDTVGLSRSAEICIRVSRLLTFTSISQVMK